MYEPTYETTLTVVHSLSLPIWVSETYLVEADGDHIFVIASVNGHVVCEDAAVGLRISLTQDPPAGVRVTTSYSLDHSADFGIPAISDWAFRAMYGNDFRSSKE